MRLLLALLLAAAALPAAARVPVAQMRESTVRVFCRLETADALELSTGSGFVIGPTYVVTNYHVVAGCDGGSGGQSLVNVGRSPGRVPTARIAWKSERLDLAVLQTERPMGLRVVRLVPGALVETGDDVLAMGYPGAADDDGRERSQDEYRFTAQDFEPTLTRGIVSRGVLGPNGEKLWQTDAAINPGNSGGPLFDACGDVIGINVRKSLTELQGPNGPIRVTDGEGIGWAVRADELIAVLAQANVSIEKTTARCGDAGPPPPSATTPTRPGGLQTDVQTQAPAPAASGRLLPWLLVGAGLAALGLGFIAFVLRGRKPAPAPPAPAPPAYAPPAPPPAYAAPRPASVAAMGGPLAGQTFGLGTPAVFGRDPQVATVRFPDSAADVSKRHARLVWDAARGEGTLEDLGSTNGTFLRGHRLTPYQPAIVHAGDRFHLARPDHTFEVRA